MKSWMKVLLGLALLLIVASFPTCQWGSHIVEGQLQQLPPAEVELHQFDMVYVRWVLPGMGMFMTGCSLAIAAIASWIGERRMARTPPHR